MDMSQSRKPDRPMSATASKGGGKKSKTPSMDMTASHVPMRGESVQATKGVHKDGMASWMSEGEGNREPMPKERFNRRSLKNSGIYTNKSA